MYIHSHGSGFPFLSFRTEIFARRETVLHCSHRNCSNEKEREREIMGFRYEYEAVFQFVSNIGRTFQQWNAVG